MKNRSKSVFLVTYNDCYGNGDESIEGYIEASDYAEAKEKLIEWCEARNKTRVAEGSCEEWEDEFDLEEIYRLDPKSE